MKTSLLGKKSSDIWNNRAPHPFLPLHDMKIEVLLDNMSNGDSFIYDCCKKVFEHYNTDIGIIQYRQEVLKDFIANNKLVTDMTNILDFVYNMQFSYHSYELIVDNPTAIISFSQKQIIQYVLGLQKLKFLLEKHQEKIHSEALRELILELNQNVSDTYVNELLSFVKCVDNLDELEMNVKLATGYKLTGFKLSHKKKRWDRIQKIKFDKNDFASVSLLNDLKQNMLQETANVLAHTADQLHKYIQNLRREMAFFQGCVSLHKELSKFGISTCFPDVCPIYEHKMEFTELGDVALALSKREKVVTNSFNLTNQNLVIITGANQGGKSTFIRSVALAQLMMQCGMFVGSSYYESSICNHIFTHFRKNEDEKLNSGKLDEELKRLSEMIEEMCTGDIVFFNESFSSTNEKEGTDLAVPITDALLSQGIRIFFVTHFYAYTNHYHDVQKENCILLNAQRNTDSSRSFQLKEGRPAATSFASDIYNSIFE